MKMKMKKGNKIKFIVHNSDKSSKNIQGRIKMCNPHWKRLGSTDKGERVIHRLGQMIGTKYDIFSFFI